MGADNWALCPQCKKNKAAQHNKAVAAAEAQYGKVPSMQYQQMLIAANHIRDNVNAPTLGEYFELGIDADGEFTVKYSANCSACGFTYTFGVKNQVELK